MTLSEPGDVTVKRGMFTMLSPLSRRLRSRPCSKMSDAACSLRMARNNRRRVGPGSAQRIVRDDSATPRLGSRQGVCHKAMSEAPRTTGGPDGTLRRECAGQGRGREPPPEPCAQVRILLGAPTRLPAKSGPDLA